MPENNHLFLFIDKYKFRLSDIANLYWDTSEISEVHVISEKNDSVKLFGRAARDGVIFFKTKHPIKWISSRKILRRFSRFPFVFQKKAILKINDDSVDPRKKIYIQKTLIISIKVENNALEFYNSREYHKVVNIKAKKIKVL